MADVLKIPPLVASEGELAVVYRTATYLWGAWNMNLPDGVEAEEFEYGRAMGYVGDLDDDPDVEDLGARRWVRADVTTDAVAKHSDVPAAFDAAEKRTAGDVFFETDIGPSGLGRLVPNVDFRVGDVVPVLVSSKVIESPVNEVRYESSPEGLVALAHVGGQLTGQPAGLEAWNSSILATINQERENQRREREAAVAAARAEAKAAAEREELERKKFESYVKTDFKYDVNQYALTTAESKSDAAREAAQKYADAQLAKRPWKEQVDDALAAARRAQSTATDANSYAYRLNSDRVAQINQLSDNVQKSLWTQQQKIDDAQNKATQANTKATQANSKAIEVNAKAIQAQQLVIDVVPRFLFLKGSGDMWSSKSTSVDLGSDFGQLYWSTSGVVPRGVVYFSARGNWSGYVWLMAVSENGAVDTVVSNIDYRTRKFYAGNGALFGSYKYATAFIFPTSSINPR